MAGGLCGGRGCALLPGRCTLEEFAFGVTRGGRGGGDGTEKGGLLSPVFGDVVCPELEAYCFDKDIVGILGEIASRRNGCKSVAMV